MNKEIHTEDVKRHIQCCIDTEDCLLCSFFKEGCDKSTFGKLMLNAVEQLERERDAAVELIKGNCKECKRVAEKWLHGCRMNPFCLKCLTNDYCNWEWRGVQKEVE